MFWDLTAVDVLHLREQAIILVNSTQEHSGQGGYKASSCFLPVSVDILRRQWENGSLKLMVVGKGFNFHNTF